MTQPNEYYDYRAGEKEGWFIAHAPGNSDGTTWRLERDDEMGLFSSDHEAHKFVVGKMFDGSTNHQKALEFLLIYEPEEFRIVVKSAERKAEEIIEKMRGQIAEGELPAFEVFVQKYLASTTAAKP